MFFKEKIGKHLETLITRKYKSRREFCIKLLELRDGIADPDSIQLMQNKVSQILKGKKWIQVDDLPLFAELLDVSIEEIVSGGSRIGLVSDRTTNYAVAASKNPAEWEKYINREDKLFLNPDEYNKTIIDYALEFGNYPFLKYLLSNDYIWFVDDNKEHWGNFGAGTSISRREPGSNDLLSLRMEQEDELRIGLINLALVHKDYDLLDSLKAREFPFLYRFVKYSSTTSDIIPEPHMLKELIDSIISSEKSVLCVL